MFTVWIESLSVHATADAPDTTPLMQDLVVITGFSGAGKSQAMACFEDAGYFCVDNLPPEMIAGLAELFEHEGSKVERAAVVSDVRGGELFDSLVRVLEELERRGLPHRLLYLEASEDVLVNRFKETRRRHPLATNGGGEGVGGQVSRAIAAERALLEPLRDRATVSIDTTDLSAARLRKVVADKMLPRGSVGKLAVTFLTYGFKHGAPRDADLLFDVRFLQNPHYQPGLRELTGRDADVSDFVFADPAAAEFMSRLEALIDFLLPAYAEEGKTSVVIGIGCTGGRHRSVAITERLAQRYSSDFSVSTSHRHVGHASVAPGPGPA